MSWLVETEVNIQGYVVFFEATGIVEEEAEVEDLFHKPFACIPPTVILTNPTDSGQNGQEKTS